MTNKPVVWQIGRGLTILVELIALALGIFGFNVGWYILAGVFTLHLAELPVGVKQGMIHHRTKQESLLMNMFVPLIDRYTQPRVYGVPR